MIPSGPVALPFLRLVNTVVTSSVETGSLIKPTFSSTSSSTGSGVLSSTSWFAEPLLSKTVRKCWCHVSNEIKMFALLVRFGAI